MHLGFSRLEYVVVSRQWAMIGYMSLGGSRAFDCTESSPGDGHNGRTVRQSHVQSRCLPCTYPRIEISTFSLANVAKSSSFYTVSNRRAPDYLMTIVVRVIFSRDQWALKGQSDHRPHFRRRAQIWKQKEGLGRIGGITDGQVIIVI